MYFYVVIGNNNEIKETLNLPRKPRPDEIKMVDGKPSLRPLVDSDLPRTDVSEIYKVSEPTMVVENSRVVRKYKTELRENFREILKKRVSSEAQTALSKVLAGPEFEGTGIVIKMMMDEEAEELLSTADDAARTKDRFPLVFAGVGIHGDSVEEVAKKYREDFASLKERIAEIQSQKMITLNMIDSAPGPDAVMRAFDSRSPLFKQK